MSRNRHWKMETEQPIGTTGATGESDKFLKFLRGRDLDVMGPFLVALKKRRSLFSWLTPGARVIGMPDWAGQDLPWVTLVDDLHPAARGPTSFDRRSLKWWTAGASVLVIDAAKPTAPLYEALGSLVTKGFLMLLVQTVEARRLWWHKYFVSVCSAGAPVIVMHHLRTTQPGGPKQVLRTGRLADDFVSDRPVRKGGELSDRRVY